MITHLLTEAELKSLERYRKGPQYKGDAYQLADALLRLCPDDDAARRRWAEVDQPNANPFNNFPPGAVQ